MVFINPNSDLLDVIIFYSNQKSYMDSYITGFRSLQNGKDTRKSILISNSHNYSTKSSGFVTIKPLYVVDEALKTRVSNNLSKCGGISPLLSG